MLLCVFVNANTELHQLLKMPAFIMHYFEHQSEDQDLSFLAYINLHYTQNVKETHHSKEHNHDSLPFKTHNCSTAHLTTGFVSVPFFQLQQPTTFQIAIASFFQNTDYVFDIGNAIWQPPKSC